MATPKQALCVVSIGYQNLLLSVADGLKVMELLQKAVSCEATYELGGKEFEAGSSPALSMQMVRADQVRMPAGAEVSPAAPRSAPKRISKAALRLKGGA